MEELICPVLQSYLLVTTLRPTFSEACYSALQVNALLYNEADSDGVAELWRKRWKGEEMDEELRQVVIDKGFWLVQRVDSPDCDQEWMDKVYNVISICAQNAVFSVLFSPPSTSLQPNWPTKGTFAVVQALQALTQSSITAVIVTSKQHLPAFRAVLEQMDLLTPKTEQGMHIDEASLLALAWKVLKCTVCRRIVYNPRVNHATEELICRQCMRDHSLPDSFPDAEIELFQSLLNSIPVTCRCGVVTEASKLDLHTLTCEAKEFFCVAHKEAFRSDAYFNHLMEKHFDFVRANAELFVNRD